MTANDFNNIIVPVRWQDWAWEFRCGYEAGYEGSKQWNPVSHRGPHGVQRREAFRAGRDAGKQDRQTHTEMRT